MKEKLGAQAGLGDKQNSQTYIFLIVYNIYTYNRIPIIKDKIRRKTLKSSFLYITFSILKYYTIMR